MSSMKVSSTCITDLPEEVLRIVFSKLSASIVLSSVVEVCIDWKSIVDTDILFWKQLKIIIDCDAFLSQRYLVIQNPISNTEQKEDWIIRIGEADLNKVGKVRNVEFCNFNRTSNQHDLLLVRILEIMGKTCENIICVRLSNCLGNNSKHFMKRLGERYKDIREIVFGINSVYLYPYAELVSFTNLRTFVSMDYTFSGKDLNTLAVNCVYLEHLWIIHSRFLKNDNFTSFLDKRKNTIKEIGIGFRVTDDVLSKIEECDKLQVLFFGDARGLSDAIFDTLNKLENLKYVSLQRAIFNPEALASWILSTNILSNLFELDLAGYYHVQGLRRWADDIQRKCIETRHILTESRWATNKMVDLNFRQSDIKITKSYWKFRCAL